MPRAVFASFTLGGLLIFQSREGRRRTEESKCLPENRNLLLEKVKEDLRLTPKPASVKISCHRLRSFTTQDQGPFCDDGKDRICTNDSKKRCRDIPIELSSTPLSHPHPTFSSAHTQASHFVK